MCTDWATESVFELEWAENITQMALGLSVCIYVWQAAYSKVTFWRLLQCSSQLLVARAPSWIKSSEGHHVMNSWNRQPFKFSAQIASDGHKISRITFLAWDEVRVYKGIPQMPGIETCPRPGSSLKHPSSLSHSRSQLAHSCAVFKKKKHWHKCSKTVCGGGVQIKV